MKYCVFSVYFSQCCLQLSCIFIYPDQISLNIFMEWTGEIGFLIWNVLFTRTLLILNIVFFAHLSLFCVDISIYICYFRYNEAVFEFFRLNVANTIDFISSHVFVVVICNYS